MIRFRLDSIPGNENRFAVYSRRRFMGWVYAREWVQSVYYGDGKYEAGVHFFKQARWYLEYPAPVLHRNIWRRQTFESKWRAAQVLTSRVREVDKHDEKICTIGHYSAAKAKAKLAPKSRWERLKEWISW